MDRITVTLLNEPRIDLAVIGARTCWKSFDRTSPEYDRKLLEHLWLNNHLSPLEHCYFTFKIEGISRLCLQELARHRIASLSVESSRYTLKKLLKEYPKLKSELEPFELVKTFFVVPKTSSPIIEQAYIVKMIKELSYLYDLMSDNPITNDELKYWLPESWRTNLVWTINLRSLSNFIILRTSPKAHFEIRHLANLILEEVDNKCEMCYNLLKLNKGDVYGKN